MSSFLDALLPPTPTGAAPNDYRLDPKWIAEGCRIYRPSWIHESVRIGTGTVIWYGAQLLEGVTIGEQCQIGAFVFLGPGCAIGTGSQLHHCAALAAGTRIGAYCYVGVSVVSTDVKEVDLRDRTKEHHMPPVIEDDVVIGQHVTINPGVTIHRGARVWSGSVVSRDVPAGWTVCGVPARRMQKPQLPFRTS
jgi:UDP-2-acetamido-3-amino-2,3-dideoxy-glucuronate N-acetyltransferase